MLIHRRKFLWSLWSFDFCYEVLHRAEACDFPLVREVPSVYSLIIVLLLSTTAYKDIHCYYLVIIVAPGIRRTGAMAPMVQWDFSNLKQHHQFNNKGFLSFKKTRFAILVAKLMIFLFVFVKLIFNINSISINHRYNMSVFYYRYCLIRFGVFFVFILLLTDSNLNPMCEGTNSIDTGLWQFR